MGSGWVESRCVKGLDRLKWSYIETILGKFGFPQIWIARVMQCVKTVTYSFVRDGQIFGKVCPERGI